MPSCKFFKGVLVPNFNKTFDRGLVLMTFQQSQETISTVGTKLHAWLNILGPGANVVMAKRRKRRGGISGGMIILHYFSRFQLQRYVDQGSNLQRCYPYGDFETPWQQRWRSLCPQNQPPSARLWVFPHFIVIMSFSTFNKCQYYFYCNVYFTSDCTMVLGSTHPLTEMSTRSISWG